MQRQAPPSSCGIDATASMTAQQQGEPGGSGTAIAGPAAAAQEQAAASAAAVASAAAGAGRRRPPPLDARLAAAVRFERNFAALGLVLHS